MKKEVSKMAYLERDGKVVATHKVTIQGTVEFVPFTEKIKLLLEMAMRGESEERRNEEAVKEIREFVERKVEEWKKVSLELVKLTLNPLELGGNVLEVVVYTSEPSYSSGSTPFLIRSSKVVEAEAKICLYDLHVKEELPDEEIKIKKVEVEQILFPEKKEQFVILY